MVWPSFTASARELWRHKRVARSRVLFEVTLVEMVTTGDQRD